MLIIIFILMTLLLFCLKAYISLKKSKSKAEFIVDLPTKKWKMASIFWLVCIILFYVLYVWRDVKLSQGVYIGFCVLYLLYYFQYLCLSATYIEVYKEKLIFNLPLKKSELLINNIENIEINKVENRRYNEVLTFNNKTDGKKIIIKNSFYNFDMLKLLLLKGELIGNKTTRKLINIDEYNFKFHFFLIVLVIILLPIIVFSSNNGNYFEEQERIELKEIGYSEEKIEQLDKQGILAVNLFCVVFGIGFVNGLYFYLIWIRDRHTLVKIILVFVAFIISPVISICGIIKLKSLINDFKLLIQNDKVKN